MQREKLIREVKEAYAQLADGQSREDFILTPPQEPVQDYLERLLSSVIHAIEEGRFDRFMNGRQVLEAVADNREHWGVVV
ncbi:MAG: hypothetical protein FWE32_04635 [Oscillospiraceae bacterium]|nr:hypothetical protein [Oscillospiraceae bacterium]